VGLVAADTEEDVELEDNEDLKINLEEDSNLNQKARDDGKDDNNEVLDNKTKLEEDSQDSGDVDREADGKDSLDGKKEGDHNPDEDLSKGFDADDTLDGCKKNSKITGLDFDYSGNSHVQDENNIRNDISDDFNRNINCYKSLELLNMNRKIRLELEDDRDQGVGTCTIALIATGTNILESSSDIRNGCFIARGSGGTTWEDSTEDVGGLTTGVGYNATREPGAQERCKGIGRSFTGLMATEGNSSGEDGASKGGEHGDGAE